MSWIRLLYPKPHFDMQGWPLWIQRIHSKALTVAYYLTQTLALIGLGIIYGVIIIPMKISYLLKGKDPLELKYVKDRNSYLKKSEPVKGIDFKRMF